ncbi:MAG: S-methyl-5'-thioadenosine phosphorylase [Acidimicrobiales bacterium]|nr:S-methyl-5'-thioadenosine phosphorylase [Acidimicrobiales bacterium]
MTVPPRPEHHATEWTADVGVIGGSGFTHLLDDTEEIRLRTHWGDPSSPVTVGTHEGQRVAFLSRHGDDHQWPPHRVNYRANIDAMRQLGVRALFGPFACGSLRPDLGPGDLVVVDQFVDRTNGRADTFHDHFHDGPRHVSLADPYDPRLRGALVDAARDRGVPVRDGGTVVVVNGPRFSTRAESAWMAAQGWHLVNMTQHPEATLAVEAGIPYAGLGLVTDRDVGVPDDPDHPPVTQEAAFAAFAENIDRVRALLLDAATRVS